MRDIDPAMTAAKAIQAQPHPHWQSDEHTAAIIRTAYAAERERYAALVAACQPFAAVAPEFTDDSADDQRIQLLWRDGKAFSVTVGGLRALSAALRSLDPAPALDAETQAEGRHMGDD